MYQTASLDRGVARILEEYRHKLFRRWIWAAKCPSGSRTESWLRGSGRETPESHWLNNRKGDFFFIILEVLLTT